MANTLFILVLFLFFNLFSMLVTIEASNFRSAACVEIERQALVQFKQKVGDPSGRLSSWIGDDCCQWKGVSCSPHAGNVISLDLRNPYNLTYPEYIMSDTEAEVFNYSCLSGEIDPSLVDLKNLQYLDLSVNNFQGIQIPEFIGSLRELKYLNLSHASFAGIIPPNLANLSNLEYLDLFPYNYIKIYPGKLWVSDANWLSQLSSLKYLNLGNVDLSLISATWVQALNELPSLVELRLPGCDLRSIPQSIPGLNLGSLRVLHLYDNHFNSSLLPQWLFNVTSLMDLNLMNSEIEGLISSYPWGKLCNLRALDLTYNEFSGEVVDLLDCLSECSNFSIEVLHMAYNQLSGKLPESIGNLWSLKSLRLFGNSLTGSIPTSIGRLSLLQDLDLSANKLSGIIPESIGQLEALTYLDLFGNSWVGNFSEHHFLKLKNLRVFSLSSVNKSLKFDVRQEWVPPFSLQVILLRDCRVGPQFPAWLQTQKELFSISLIGDGISDPIPGWFWNFTQQLMWLELQNNQFHGKIPELLNFSLTQRVDISSNRLVGAFPICLNVLSLSFNDNNFSGPIPSNIGQMMPKTSVLQLSGNSFSGEIPASLIEMKQLITLDFSNNKLSGEIPSNWQGLEKIDTIDFSQNNLSGGIPSSMCSRSQLQVLKLFANNLSGLLSQSLINCTSVSSLDLGYNQFTGNIPSWIGERLLPVEILILRANMLTGSIPESLCRLPDLHIMDFAHNNLSGRIPPCLGNLSSLMSFRLYNPVTNRLIYSEQIDLNVKGRELEYTKILPVVNVIDLSGNNLQEQIPDDITELSYLGTLNLSRNQLCGEIPQSIGELKHLESLDLSSNKLSGSIPLSMPSMTALNYLNLSDNDLSGPIPSSNQFQTFVDPSIYEGNPGLCGFPLPNTCSTTNQGNKDDEIMEDDESDWIDMIWFYSGLAPGFMVGFWVVCGTLIVKKTWRHAYFNIVDAMKDSIYSSLSK